MSIKLDDITIRSERKKGDLGCIIYMHGLYYDYGIEFELYVADLLTAFYRSMNPSDECMWLAEYNDEVIGSICLKNTNRQARLRYFLIHPDFRGIGLGKRMMDTFMEFLHAKNYQTSFLTTEGNLHRAAQLYEKYGYRYDSSSMTDFGLEEKKYVLHLCSK